jgi:hypothetical protein
MVVGSVVGVSVGGGSVGGGIVIVGASVCVGCTLLTDVLSASAAVAEARLVAVAARGVALASAASLEGVSVAVEAAISVASGVASAPSVLGSKRKMAAARTRKTTMPTPPKPSH